MARSANGAPPEEAQEDESLLTRASEGDEDAFAAIVERYRAPLVRHVRRIAGDGAEDAVQQALMNAWTALRRGNVVRELRPWLFTIARRAASGTLRAEGERAHERCNGPALERSSAEHAEHAARTREMLEAIAGLPERERDALVWTSIHGRSGREAARELGVSEDAVRALVHRARSRLREPGEAVGTVADAIAAISG